MKVCTDACILGALVAKETESFSPEKILDIGCGTGLLSLMIAQKSGGIIHAVEINEDAAVQAKENVAASPWANRIRIIHADILDIKSADKYGLIISNPPFFEDDLKSEDKNKNDAKHDTTLKLESLLASIKMHITADGIAAVLLPFHRTEWFEERAAADFLFVQKKVLIRQTPQHDYFRSVIFLSAVPRDETKIESLVIHDNNRQYTEAFKMLLKDYYLKC